MFLKRLESQMLSNLALRGVPDIKKVFIREAGAYTRALFSST